MLRPSKALVTLLAASALAACATRSGDIAPAKTNPTEFLSWDCGRMHDEIDRVQRRAADLAYAVDERAGNNIIALGVGLVVFWPVLVAMRPPGVEAEELAQLKGRYETLQTVVAERPCALPPQTLSAERAAKLPVVLGERLVYEQRESPRSRTVEQTLVITALRRGDIEFVSTGRGQAEARWQQDFAGNVLAAPGGALQWKRLLKPDLVLGQVLAGEMIYVDIPTRSARVRGQVVAVGPQAVDGHAFDAAVIELFGDARNGEDSSRLDGVLVIDRSSGVLLRLDLRSPQPGFMLRRRLVRVEPPAR